MFSYSSVLLQVFPHTSLNTTAERHFAEIIRDHIVEEIQLVEKDFETTVKAVITDAASDCRKARRLVVERHPCIVSLDCFAHQVRFTILGMPRYLFQHLSSDYTCMK